MQEYTHCHCDIKVTCKVIAFHCTLYHAEVHVVLELKGHHNAYELVTTVSFSENIWPQLSYSPKGAALFFILTVIKCQFLTVVVVNKR